MDVTDAIYGRRAVREYTNASIDRVLLQRLIEAAIQAPSALNQQPWLFTVVSDQKLLAEISEKSKAHLLGTLGLEGDKSLDQLRKMLADPEFHLFYHAPSLIVISASHAARWAGLTATIEACGRVLAEHFPPGRENRNERPNHLTLLDAR